MTVSEKLKELRTERNMTQQQMADRLGINQSVLSRWESGATAPSLKFIRVITSYFNISVHEFLNRDTKQNPQKSKRT